jgi:hypothetical protein
LVNGAATRFNGLLNGHGNSTSRRHQKTYRASRRSNTALPPNSHLSVSCPSIIVAGNPTTIWWSRQEFTDRRRRSSIDRRGRPEDEFNDIRCRCMSMHIDAVGRNAIINRANRQMSEMTAEFLRLGSQIENNGSSSQFDSVGRDRILLDDNGQQSPKYRQCDSRGNGDSCKCAGVAVIVGNELW